MKIHFPTKIPVTIHPTFWLFAAVIGFLNSMSFVGTLVWVGIIFVSVLFHEFGHALTAGFFGRHPRIELVALGGLTYHDGDKLPFWKQFFIVLNGPLFGFILFLLATLLLQFSPFNVGFAGAVIKLTQAVNLFWTVVNLLPVMPLDGGQLLRVILEAIFGVKGFKYALFTGMVTAALISLFFFLYQAFLIGALFFLLAFQSYDTFRRTRNITAQDRSDRVKKEFDRAEQDLREGKKDKAIAEFERICAETGKGVFFNLAAQYLAYLKYEMGKTKECYDLLKSILPDLSLESMCLLHRVAFEQKDYPLVAELSGKCFQAFPDADMALRSACAYAQMSQVKPTVGWLQAAIQEGVQNISEILSEKAFDAVRNENAFKEFVHSLEERREELS